MRASWRFARFFGCWTTSLKASPFFFASWLTWYNKLSTTLYWSIGVTRRLTSEEQSSKRSQTSPRERFIWLTFSHCRVQRFLLSFQCCSFRIIVFAQGKRAASFQYSGSLASLFKFLLWRGSVAILFHSSCHH